MSVINLLCISIGNKPWVRTTTQLPVLSLGTVQYFIRLDRDSVHDISRRNIFVFYSVYTLWAINRTSYGRYRPAESFKKHGTALGK